MPSLLNLRARPAPLLFPSFPAADILSALEFDETGEFLASGDKGGRIVIFQRQVSPSVSASAPL
jgi:hypothetical protein